MLFALDRQYLAANIFFLLFMLFLFVTKSDLLIFIYVAFLPTNGFIPAESKFLGIFHILQTTHLFTLLRLIQIKNGRNLKISEILKSNPGVRTASTLIIIVFAYYFLLEIKLSFILSGVEFTKVITRLIKYSILFISLYYLMIIAIYEKYRVIIRSGYLLSILVISISIVFSEKLVRIGLPVNTLTTEFFKEGVKLQRTGGFFCDFGSLISAGSFLSMSAAFLLYERYNNKHINNLFNGSLLILAYTGIFFTISRTPITSGLIVLLLYIFITYRRALNPRHILGLAILSILTILFIGTPLYNNILFRFDITDRAMDQQELFTRGGTWLFYLNYFKENIHLFFIGAIENPFRQYFNMVRSAHNFYLQLYFYFGAIGYYFLFVWLKRYFGNTKYFSINLFILIIPFIAETFFVSELAIVFPFVIILILTFKYDYSTETLSLNDHLTNQINKRK